MKKISALILSFCFVLCIFTGCSSGSDGQGANADGGESNASVKVGIAIATTSQERWGREFKLFEDYANENGIEVLLQIANDDVQKQAAQVENLINQGIDVLIIQGCDSDASVASVELCHQAGIKVIAYDRIINTSDVDYYVTFDSIRVGEEIAKATLAVVDKGNFMLLEGGPEDNNAHLIHEGHMNVLQPYIDDGSINIVAEQWCANWDPNEALGHVENALVANNNNIQAIIAPNDGCAGGAIQALVAEKLAGVVPIAGQDGELSACQRIVEGTQTASVYKPISNSNKAVMDLAVAVASGTEDPISGLDSALGEKGTYKDYATECFYVDVDVLTAENLYDIVIARDAFHTVEDVYANIPQDQWPK